MILRSLEVDGFRCFDRTLRVDGFGPKLNVIYGPNGAGKSTLLRALRHALVDSHGLTGAVVKQAMNPWGRTLSPRIRVEFTHDDTVWRIEKRFLAGAASRLEREESDGFRPVADGREADQRVRDMLLAEAAAKGMAAESHLGLLQVLWTPQGPPVLTPWNAEVRRTLREAFGSALSSPEADALADLVGRRYSAYFTGTGRVSSKSPVTPMQEEFARGADESGRLRNDWQAASAKREELAGIAERIARNAGRAEQLQPVLDAVAEEQRARQEFEPLDRRLSAWRAAAQSRRNLDEQIEAAQTRHTLALAAVAAAEADQRKIEALDSELTLLQRSGEDAKEWGDLRRWRALTARRTELRDAIAALRAPTAAVMDELTRLAQQLEVKQAGLLAASLRLTIEAESSLALESGGESVSVSPGEPLVLTSPQSVSVRIPGVVRMTAASANAQAADLARQVTGLEAQLERLRNGEPLDMLRDRYSRATALNEELGQVDAEARPLDARASMFRELVGRRPDWETDSPNIEGIRANWRTCKDALDRLRAVSNMPAAAASEASARTALEGLRRTRDDVATRLAQFAAAGPLDELEAAHAHARAQLQAAQNAMGSCGDAAALGRELQTLQTELQRDREARARLEGELKTFESQNLYSRLADAEARLTDTTEKLARERRRAAAIELLQATLAESQRAQTAALPTQIAGAATKIWRRIAGEAAPAIQIDDTWTPAGLQVPDANAALGELSGGEAEQVAFATRLALAEQLAQSTRQLAVFDDAFLATDPARADRILQILAEASGRLQIIVLTCHPARYAALPDVTRFDLEQLKG